MNAKISVVIPVYNEAESVEELHAQLLAVFQNMGHAYEIIFVDDGSTDSTLVQLKRLSPARIISFTRNFGKSQALQAGFAHANGDYIITLDSDLQDDPREIPRLLQKIEQDHLDLVSGWKIRRADSFSKKIVSRIANAVTRFVTKTAVHDMNCCFKIYRAEVVRHLELYGDMHRYIPSLVAHMGFSVGELIVNHRERKYGKSKYGITRLASGFFDFITLIFLRKFMDRPLHFFGFLGGLLSAAGLLILLHLTWITLVDGVIIMGRPRLLFGVLFVVVGFQLLSIGLLGELMIRQASPDRKQYHIRKVITNE